MADYSRDDAAYATRVVNRLINREGDGLDLEQDIAVSDVQWDAIGFSDELSLLERFDANVPAVRIAGETVPISLAVAVGWPPSPFGIGMARPWLTHPWFYEAMSGLLPILRGQQSQGYPFTTISRQEARSTFIRRAAEFVATRVAAIRGFRNHLWDGPSLNLHQLLSGPRVATPGCNFTVSTNSSGLRVFWSGAYYVTPNNFNHPTTPTSSVLQSGTYVFGVDGGAYGNNIHWDLNLVVTLPGLPYAHLNF